MYLPRPGLNIKEVFLKEISLLSAEWTSKHWKAAQLLVWSIGLQWLSTIMPSSGLPAYWECWHHYFRNWNAYCIILYWYCIFFLLVPLLCSAPGSTCLCSCFFGQKSQSCIRLAWASLFKFLRQIIHLSLWRQKSTKITIKCMHFYKFGLLFIFFQKTFHPHKL